MKWIIGSIPSFPKLGYGVEGSSSQQMCCGSRKISGFGPILQLPFVAQGIGESVKGTDWWLPLEFDVWCGPGGLVVAMLFLLTAFFEQVIMEELLFKVFSPFLCPICRYVVIGCNLWKNVAIKHKDDTR